MKKILLILLFLLFSCQNDYTTFHNDKKNNLLQEKEIDEELKNFSLEKINYLSGVEIRSTPDLKLLDELVSKIEKAKTKVYIEMYIFTEKRLIKALKDAKNRGIDVKVILEKNVYLAPSLNNKTYNELISKNIKIVWSNKDNYALNHTKMMLIDEEGFISTGNYSYSTFKYNREFFLFIKNIEILNKLLEIFDADFNGIKKNIYHDNLILSPFYTRDKFEYILKSAKSEINIYSLNFGDERIKEILLQKAKEGIKINIIFPNIKEVKSNIDEIELFKSNGLNIKTLDKIKLHAKAILVDKKYLYLGSINFSSYSIDKNREIGLLLSNKDIIDKFLNIFNNDLK